MKKIALWAGIATLVFTGIAQADPIQSTYPWQPGYDPFPAGDTVVSVTLSGTITGGSEAGAGGIDGLGIFQRQDLLNAPILVNLFWDETAVDYIANNYNPTSPDSGAGDGFSFIFAWYPNADEYPWPFAPISSTSVVGTSRSAAFSAQQSYATAAFDIYGCGMGPTAPQDCLAVSASSPGSAFEFLAANSDGTPASVDISSQAAVNAFLSNPDNTYTLLYSFGPEGETLNGFSESEGDDVFTANLSLVTSSPEPATWTLLAMALTGGALLKLRQRKRG